MEQEKIRELSGKYFEGETSEDEELLLREYLNDPSAPESVRKEFGFLPGQTDEVPEPSEGFYDRLEAVTHREISTKPRGKVWRYLTGVAGAAAIVAGLWLVFRFPGSPQVKDTYDDPMIAMAEVRNILMTVSERMNSGTEQLEQVSTFAEKPEELEGLGRIGDIVGQNLYRLRYLGELKPVQNETETD
jgi:hypothetical protein